MGLDTIELVILIKDEFDIELSNEEASTIETVGELTHSIESLAAPSAKPVLLDSIYARIETILIEEFRVKPSLITPSARIVKDLGLD